MRNIPALQQPAIELTTWFFSISVVKIGLYPDAIAALEESLAMRFNGCSRIKGLKVFDLWNASAEELPCLNDNRVWMVALKNNRQDFRDFASLLLATARQIEQQAIMLINAPGTTVIIDTPGTESKLLAA